MSGAGDPHDDPFGGFVDFAPMPGGTSGETFLAATVGESSVVRILAAPHHHPDAPDIQAALLHLVRDLLPVPPVLEVRRSGAPDGEPSPGLLVTGLLQGVRADQLIPGLAEAGQRRVGAALGAVAAALASMPTLRPGRWADADLRIEAPDPRRTTLAGRVEGHRDRWAAAGWSTEEVATLSRHAEEADDVLAGVRRTCVVHGDLAAENLLLDPDTLEVTGVVDWEESHSGHPWADLGSLLRADAPPAYVDGVLDAWADRHPTPREELVAGARAGDLGRLVELAARDVQGPAAAALRRLTADERR